MSNLCRNHRDLISLAIFINEANFRELLRFIKVNHFAKKDAWYFKDEIRLIIGQFSILKFERNTKDLI